MRETSERDARDEADAMRPMRGMLEILHEAAVIHTHTEISLDPIVIWQRPFLEHCSLLILAKSSKGACTEHPDWACSERT